MDAIKIAQDLPALWDAAPPPRRKELFWSLFESAKIEGGRLVSVRPKPELAPLLALAVHICGPDRGWELRCDLHGLQVEGIDDLLELAAAVA